MRFFLFGSASLFFYDYTGNIHVLYVMNPIFYISANRFYPWRWRGFSFIQIKGSYFKGELLCLFFKWISFVCLCTISSGWTYRNTFHTQMTMMVDGWLVDCGLTSHSAIFQLYTDGTDVQYQNFDLLPDTQRHGQLGVFSVPSLPRHGYRGVPRRLLPPCHRRAHTRWG